MSYSVRNGLSRAEQFQLPENPDLHLANVLPPHAQGHRPYKGSNMIPWHDALSTSTQPICISMTTRHVTPEKECTPGSLLEGKWKPAAPASCSVVSRYFFIFSQSWIAYKLIHRKHWAKWASAKASVNIICLLFFVYIFWKAKIITEGHVDLSFKKNICLYKMRGCSHIN